ncbi:MAG TPA: kelch repeat-containing protein, partial [Gemmatimonadales bacterium]|nr:kelch repeat-containing protein [Gemmatimonadales bacterium]
MTTLRQIGFWALTATLAAVSLTCSSDSDLSEPAQPAALVMVDGNGQVGAINQTLPDSLIVRVDGDDGQPLAGVSVGWTVAGGGSVDHSAVLSGADGRAAVVRVLGGTAGELTTTATVSDLIVTFSSTAQAGEEPQLIVATQPSSTAKDDVPLIQQPVLRAEDAVGEPLPAGLSVTASVEGATLTGTTTRTSDGFGQVRFTDLALSGSDGSYNLTFSASGVVSVRSTDIVLSSATEGGQVVITTQPSSAAENGVALGQQPVVRVENGAGQPVGAGVPVTASVTGVTLSGTAVVETDASGNASFTNLALSGANGTYHLTFSAPNAAEAQSTAVTLATTSAEAGQWTAPFDWPIVAVHMMLLPDGRVLSIGRTRNPQVWDPATGVFTDLPSPARLFCAGHVLLADGRVLVVGGHISDGHGLPNMTLFSPTDNTWSSSTPMARGRWYPTATVMGNGDVAIEAGTDEDSLVVTIPEVWSNGSIRQLTGAKDSLPWYPRSFLAPDGSLFLAGAPRSTRFVSVSGVGSSRPGPKHLFDQGRNYGSAVMYDDGKILYAGGAYTTNTAETIDLDAPSPTWSWTAPMAFARRHFNLTVLPTGEVLATGGVAGTLFNDLTKGVHAAELWDPKAGTNGEWTTLASNVITRGYHGTSLLLPDGRVL